MITARLILTVLAFLAVSLSRAEEKRLGEVLIFVSTDCPIANAYSPEFSRIHEEFGAKGFSFLLVYPESATTEDEIAAHREEYALSIPGTKDPDHAWVKKAGATITPEAAIFDANDTLVYRGRIDNLFNDYGDKRRVVTEFYLRDALEALLAGKKLTFTETEPVGCFIEPLE